MTRQYIGARYVPKFYENSSGTSEWRSGVQYEPLTIVTYNGNSYTSKKNVPATVGNPSANPEYWASTGIYNQQVEQLREEVEEIAEQIDNVESDVSDLKRESGLYPHWLFVGDSYNDPSYSNWGNALANAMGLDGEDFDVLYIDGGSFYSEAMYNLVYNYATTHSVEQRANVGNIVVLGGINDANPNITNWSSQLGEKIQAFCTYCKANYQNAKILIGYCGNSLENSPILNGRNYWRITKSLEQYQACYRYGAEYLQNMEFVMRDYSLFSSDGIHPTVDGGIAIARAALGAIKRYYKNTRSHYYNDAQSIASEMYDITHNIDSNLGSVSILAPGGSKPYNVSVIQDGSITTVNFGARIALLTTSGAPVTLNVGTTLNIGIMAEKLWNGKSGLIIPVSGSARHADNTSVFSDICGWLTVNGGNITFTVDRLDDRWSGSPVVADQVLIKPWTITASTLLF